MPPEVLLQREAGKWGHIHGAKQRDAEPTHNTHKWGFFIPEYCYMHRKPQKGKPLRFRKGLPNIMVLIRSMRMARDLELI